MAINFKKLWTGITIVPKTSSTSDSKGELEVISSTGKLNYHNGTSISPVVTEAHTATLTNKTLTSPVINSPTGITKADVGLSNVDNTSDATKNAAAVTLTNKTIDIDAQASVTNISNGNIKVGAAIDASKIANGSVSNTEFQYLDGVTSAIQTQLNSKSSSTLTDTHIFVGNGSNIATDVAVSGDLTLSNTGNFQIASGAILNVDVNASAAIDASKIANGSVSSTEFQYLDGVTSAIQTQIDTKIAGITVQDEGTPLTTAATTLNFVGAGVTASGTGATKTITVASSGDVTGPGSSTDKHLVRFNGTTGKAIQDGSTVTLSDAGALSGLTGVSSSGTAAFADITASATTTFTGTFDANGLVQFASANDNATGANVTLTTPTTKVIRLTNASLVSIDGIPAGADAREVILENATGTTVVINEDTGATAANRFYTGTTSGINLADKASLYMSYDTTSNRWRVIGGAGSGSGSQVPDTFVQLVADELISVWSTGNNATFLGGGSISGTFAKDTTTILNGTASYRYTQASGSLNDYIASAAQSVPLRFRGNQCTVYFPYTYDGGSSDLEPVIWDATNSAKLNVTTNLLPVTQTTGAIYKVNVTIPASCTSIRFGFQTKIANNGKILKFDDVQFSADTTKYADAGLITDWVAYTPTFTGFGTVTNLEAYYRRVGDSVEISARFTAGTTTATEARVSLPTNLTSKTFTQGLRTAGYFYRGAASAANFMSVLIESAVTYVTFGIASNSQNPTSKQTGSNITTSGETSIFKAIIPIAGYTASNPQIITASDSFSSDTAQFVYAGSGTYTLSTLPDAPIGTFITYTYASGGNAATQTTSAPTQTTADMNASGVRVFARAFNATSTSAQPAYVVIQIGKNYKGFASSIYLNTNKSTIMTNDYTNVSSTIRLGTYTSYDEKTGLYYIDSGFNIINTITTAYAAIDFATYTAQTSGYFSINASRSPALVGVPQVQPRFAILSDVKATNTAGGTATSGSWQTRTLNTIVDNSSLVSSLSSNQFTLAAGEYYIEGSAPAYRVNSHKTRIQNITAGSTALLGSSEYTAAADVVTTRSFFSGPVTITTASVFELQHQVQTTQSTNGYGDVGGGFSVSETYGIIKITKVK